MKILQLNTKTQRLVMISLMMCIILTGTSLFKIPIPLTQGYVHLGDAMIYLSVILLGRRDGSVAAGLGSALGDILGGYAFWAPWTLIIKFAMAFATGLIIDKVHAHESDAVSAHSSVTSRSSVSGSDRTNETGSYHDSVRFVTALDIIGMVIGGLVMAAGYLVVERFMYGSWGVALLGLPWNIGQFIAGIIVALIISGGIRKAVQR